MPRDRDESKLRPDANELAFQTVRAALGEAEKPQPRGKGTRNPEAVKRGRKGGLKGGPARKKGLTAKRRSAIARKAAKARWSPKP